MSDIETRFKAAVRDIQHLPSRPDEEKLLQLYALYKQGTAGDATGKRPGMFDMVGRAKFDAWAKLKGMKVEDAQQTYADMVEALKSPS